jgi:hypothetical protein
MKIENIKKEYAFGILLILLTVIFLLFFRDKITGVFVSPTNAPETMADKLTYDTYKALVDSYTPSWNERDCYSLFGLDEDRFDQEFYSQVYPIHVKIRALETNTSREYSTRSFFTLKNHFIFYFLLKSL